MTLNQLLDNKREVALSESSDYSSCWCALGYKKSVGQRSLQKLYAIVFCISWWEFMAKCFSSWKTVEVELLEKKLARFHTFSIPWMSSRVKVTFNDSSRVTEKNNPFVGAVTFGRHANSPNKMLPNPSDSKFELWAFQWLRAFSPEMELDSWLELLKNGKFAFGELTLRGIVLAPFWDQLNWVRRKALTLLFTFLLHLIDWRNFLVQSRVSSCFHQEAPKDPILFSVKDNLRHNGIEAFWLAQNGLMKQPIRMFD